MPVPMLVDRLTSDAVIDRAYDWLCKRRRNYPDRADVWSLRRNWRSEKIRLVDELRSGDFRFALLDSF